MTIIENMLEYVPEEEDFTWNGEAGDWTPYYCDDCDTWHKTASYENIGRTNGKLWIECMSVDECGDHEIDTRWEEGEDPAHSELEWYIGAYSLDQYFVQWAQYHLWCVEQSIAEQKPIDPLEEIMELCDLDTWVCQHIDGAISHMNYRFMRSPARKGSDPQ
jgi:hypothetical protein